MINDNEFETKENKIYTKNKIEPQHIQPRSQPRWILLILIFMKKRLKGFLKVNCVNCAPHVDMHANIVKDEVIWDRKYGTIIIR